MKGGLEGGGRFPPTLMQFSLSFPASLLPSAFNPFLSYLLKMKFFTLLSECVFLQPKRKSQLNEIVIVI